MGNTPLSGPGGELHIASLALGDLPGQIQPDANALLNLVGLPPVKPLEHHWLLLLRNSRACIPHLNGGEHGVGEDPHPDFPSGRRVFHRIIQKVIQGFLRPLPVKYRFTGGALPDEADLLFPGQRQHLGGGGVHHGLQGLLYRMKLDDPRFQPGGLYQSGNEDLKFFRLL